MATKTVRTLSLDVSLCDALKAASLARGRSMSSLVEDAVRAFLALPVPVAGVEAEPEFRAIERELLAILAAKPVLGPDGAGWHSVIALANEHGATVHVVEKALKALAREGKAFCWGEGRGVPVIGVNCVGESDRRFSFGAAETRWAARDPRAIVKALVDRWVNGGKVPPYPAPLLLKMQPMLTGASESLVKECCDIFSAAVGWDLSRPELGFYTRTPADEVAFKQAEQQRYYDSPEYAAKKAAEKAAQEKAIDDRRAAMAAHDAEQRRLDAEARAERAERAANYCAGCGGDKRVCGCNVSR